MHATDTDVVPPGMPSASRASTTIPKHVAAPEPAHDTATAWAALTCMPRHASDGLAVHETDVETVPLPLRTVMFWHVLSPTPAQVTATDDGDAADRVATCTARHRECGLPR